MKSLVLKTYHNPKYAKIKHWGKLISIAGSTQIIVQGLSLLSGILIIRLLSTQEYALYTLVNAMLATMTILADGGVGAGVMSQGSQVWQDREKLGSVIITGFELRKLFAIGSLLVAIPILLYLLLHNNASWIKAIIITLTLIPAFVAALSDSLLEIAPKLRQDIGALQKNQIFVSILRLLFIGFIFIFPFAYIAILANGLPRAWGNFKLRKISSKYSNWNQKPDPIVRQNILKMVKRILPGSIYYCVSGQITIWIISVFGDAKSVAQVGALGRLTMILNLVTVLFNTLIVPRFARLSNKRNVLMPKLIYIVIGIFSVLFLITTVVWLFPKPILWVLGRSYSNLSIALILSVIGNCMGLMAGLLFALATCKGWTLNPVILIGVNVLAIIAGCLVFQISTVTGVLLFNILISGIPILIWLFFIIYKVLTVEKQIAGN